MMSEEALSVYLIASIYYKNYIPNLLRSIKKLSDFHRLEKVVVVLNNPSIAPPAVEGSLKTLVSKIEFVHHDNTGGEFGAYQLGVDCLREELNSKACLIIVNETMGMHFPFEREHADGFMRSLLDRQHPCRVVGHIDYFERDFGIDDCRSCRWIRSNLLGFDFAAISSINFRVYAPHIQSYIRDTDVAAEFFAGEIDRFLQGYVADWLFSEGGWYGAAALSKDNAPSLAFKARSILQEKYLSMRLEQHQAAFLPFRYTPLEQVTRRAKHGLRSVMRALGATRRPGRT